MTLTTAAVNAGVTAIGALGGKVRLHTANPGSTGASEVAGGTYARQTTTWGAAANGVRTGSTVSFAVPAATTVTHYSIWSADDATLIDAGPLSTSETYTGAGTYNFTPTLTVTAV